MTEHDDKREPKMPVRDKRRQAPGPRPEVNESPPAVEAVEDEKHDYLEDLKRVQAEFDNYRKRMVREQTAMAQRASARLVERLLPVLDNFERAIAHGEGGSGVELVYKDLLKTLGDEGLVEIPSEGQPFDPTRHEAVDSIDDPDASEPVVRTVYRRGYLLKDRVLRPAMVVVARPGDEHTEDNDEQAAEG